jgi:hypothetical protein
VAIPKNADGSETGMASGLVGEYVPGLTAKTFPQGTALMLPAGTDLVLQLHYTPNGKATTDLSKIGLYFASEAPKERFFTTAITTTRYVIPPGAPDVPVEAKVTLGTEVRLLYVQPHMHLRGKSFEYTVRYPDGKEEVLLRVPHYDFNWQLRYEIEGGRTLPAGTTITARAVYDNSPNNPRNPDPTAEVRHGLQSTDEMMTGVLHLAFDPATDLRRLMVRPVAGAYDSEKRIAAH